MGPGDELYGASGLHLGSDEDTTGAQPGTRWVASHDKCPRWLKYVLVDVVVVF